MRDIAGRLGRAPSTVSQELRRKASTRTSRLDYDASIAQGHANDRLRQYVQVKLSGVVPGPDGRIVVGPAGG